MAFGFTIDGSNPFNAIFVPLANKIAENFQNQGIEVFNAQLIRNNNYPRIIFGAHSNANFWLENKNVADIFLNCEPIFLETWQNVNPQYLKLLNSSRVLDYSKKSELFVKNFHLFPMPPFFNSSYETKKTTEVLFVGSMNENRKTAFQKLENTGVDITIKFKIFGNDLFQEIEKAKLFLDTNFHPNGSIFNMFRFCLCADTGTVYTGESGITSDYPEIEQLNGLTISNNAEKVPELIEKLLSNDEHRKHVLKIQRRIANTLDKNFQNFFRVFGKEFK